MIPLNKDCLALIFAYCGIYNKLNISLTCKYFNKICNDINYDLNLKKYDIEYIINHHYCNKNNIYLIELFLHNNLINPYFNHDLPIKLAFHYKMNNIITSFYKNNIIKSHNQYRSDLILKKEFNGTHYQLIYVNILDYLTIGLDRCSIDKITIIHNEKKV